MDIKNVIETKKLIWELMDEVEKSECSSNKINELKELLEEIGSKPSLYALYEDIYDDASDARKTAALAISIGLPILPSKVFFEYFSTNFKS